MDKYNYDVDPSYWSPEILAQHEAWLELLSLDQIKTDGFEIIYKSDVLETTDEKTKYYRGLISLNGANVDPKYELRHKFNYTHEKDNNTGNFKIADCSFTMPSEFRYLGELFDRMPWGIVKKNRTGLGATTLELSSSRHSIVVVPTRALAYEKAKNSKIENTNRFKFLYIGGKIPGFSVPSIQQYIADEKIEYKKFIVVIDSLDRLLKEIGEDNWKDYFIMFDEIDSYQYDSWFRPNMERNFSYYFKFPQSKRCLVSATLGEFSNPQINAEPLINIDFSENEIKPIGLLETNEPTMSAAKHILKINQEHPQDQILIAYNLVTRGILPIILCLPEELRNECSVLCSEKSREHVKDYYKEVVDNKLPSRITFMSCTYFVGIDFSERYHLISIANKTYPFTLLSAEKLQQIAGRCRNEQGILSHTLIYNTYNSTITPDYPNIQNKLIDDANQLITLSDSMEKVSKTFPKLLQPFHRIFLDQFVKHSVKGYCGSSEVRCVREEDNKLMISYFNIDNALIQIRLLHSMYNSNEKVNESLSLIGFTSVTYPPITQEEPIPSSITEHIDSIKIANEEAELEGILEELRQVNSVEERVMLAETRRTNSLNKVSEYLERFKKLHQYVPFEPLITLISLDMKKQEYEYLYNAVLLWSLDKEHGIKKAWEQSFIIGEKYKGTEIIDKVNSIWNGLLNLGLLKPNQAMRLAQKYFVTLEKTTKRSDKGTPLRVYEVMNLNPMNLPADHNEIIPENVNIQNMIL